VKARGAWAFALLAALAAGPARADESGATPEELFQWGEYDSLIRTLEPVLASLSAGASARGDSLELAKANLWLGVAYWATGKRDLAEQAFVRGCRLDPGLVLDRLYATPEIFARFDSISARERQERLAASAAAIALPEGTSPAQARNPSAPKPTPADARPWHKRGWALGALTAAGLAAGGAYYYVATRKDDVVINVSPGKPD
jgi:hypothetical protein